MRAALAAWQKQHDTNYALREQAFRTDLGATCVAPAETKSHAVQRGPSKSGVPTYDASSDPHLVVFHRNHSHSHPPRPSSSVAKKRSEVRGARHHHHYLSDDGRLLSSTAAAATDRHHQQQRPASSSVGGGVQSRGSTALAEGSAAPAGYRSASANRAFTSKAHAELLQSSAHDRISSAMISCPTSVEHVLALKHIFFRFSLEITAGAACRHKFCPVQQQKRQQNADTGAAPVLYEKVRLLPTKAIDLPSVVALGIAATNEHRKLNRHPPLPSVVSPERLYEWLVLLNCRETVDWPSFLVLCTAHPTRDFKLLCELRSAYDAFVRNTDMSGPESYNEMLSALLHTTSLAAKYPEDAGPPANFYQTSDFYRHRHCCNFADAIFSLLPHCVQYYLNNANARGMNLLTNFGGRGPHHDAVTAALAERREKERRGECVSPERDEQQLFSDRMRRRGAVIPPSKNVKAEYIHKQSLRLRFSNRVWL